MRKANLTLKILAVCPWLFLLVACNPLENDTKALSLVVIESLTGTDTAGNEGNFVQSDVQKIDKDTGTAYVVADIGKATLSARLIDPAPKYGTSSYADIQLTRYVVTYTRSDGKNTPGIDVPYPIEGNLSALIKVDVQSSIIFVVVKEVAKLEPPLLSLVQNRAEGVLNVTAKVDLYGHDMLNNNVKTTGYLSIFFANYFDK
jgi:hypothetical protein